MNAQEHLERGVDCFNNDDIDQAIAEFTEAFRIDPSLAAAKGHLHTAYYNRGVMNFQNGNNDLAIADLSKAIKFSPSDDATVYNARGMLYNEMENNDGVIQDFTEVIRIAPTDAAYFFRSTGYRGKYKAYGAAGDEDNFFKYIDLAIDDLKTASQIAPDANHQKGVDLLISERELREKANDSQKAQMSQFEKTIVDTTKVIQINPKDAKAYYDRASAYGVLGNSKQSIEDFTMAINLCPTCGGYIGRGYEYGKSGDSQKAIYDFKMAVQLGPGNDAARNFLDEALAGTIRY